MKNKVTLHEAIAKVLILKENKTATYNEIADEITKQNLYPNRKGNIPLAKQIYLRSSISSSKYLGTWFEIVDNDEIKLIKNCC